VDTDPLARNSDAPQLAVGELSLPATTGHGDRPAGRNESTGATGATGATFAAARGATATVVVDTADAAVGTVNEADITAPTISPTNHTRRNGTQPTP
jgi:hypothetical protein